MTDRPFQLVSPFAPAGDQPQAIAKLVDGLKSGLAQQTLLGVTGSRQDVHDGERHRARAAAHAGAGAQQDARRAALRRVPRVLPAQRGGVLRLVLRLLPARGVRALDRHVHREGLVDQRAHRADAPVGDEGAARAPDVDHRRDGVGDLRPRRSRGLPRRWCCTSRAATRSTSASCCAGSRTCSTRATSSILHAARIACAATSIDIFPAESERDAVRVELFDDEIEQIALFDPLTGEVAAQAAALHDLSRRRTT